MVMVDFRNPNVLQSTSLVCLSLVQRDKTYSITVFLALPTKRQVAEDDGGETLQLLHLDKWDQEFRLWALKCFTSVIFLRLSWKQNKISWPMCRCKLRNLLLMSMLMMSHRLLISLIRVGIMGAVAKSKNPLTDLLSYNISGGVLR